MAEPPQAAHFFIALLPVGVPPQIDFPQLVVRQGESEAIVLKNERWLSPLADEIRSALSGELSQRLGTQDVANLSHPGNMPVIKIQVQLKRFDSWPGRNVNLQASWSLSTPEKRLVCFSQLVEPTSPGYTAMILTQQRILSLLSAQIAFTVRHWVQDPHRGCIG
jgi:hypothetical protein